MINGGMEIYFFKPSGMAGPIKIGCSRAPAKRLAYLARWSPFPLECVGSVVGDIVFERAIHRRFAHLHSHAEWFRQDQELVEFVEFAVRLSRIDDAFAVRDGVLTSPLAMKAAA